MTILPSCLATSFEDPSIWLEWKGSEPNNISSFWVNFFVRWICGPLFWKYTYRKLILNFRVVNVVFFILTFILYFGFSFIIVAINAILTRKFYDFYMILEFIIMFSFSFLLNLDEITRRRRLPYHIDISTNIIYIHT